MKSMTGYGKSSFQTDTYEVIVEAKSVNNRYLDTIIRMPKEFNALEISLKNIAKKYLTRGRVECFVTVKMETIDSQKIAIKWNLLDQLVTELNEAQDNRYIDSDFSANSILTGAIMNPALFEVTDSDEKSEELEDDLRRVFEEAIINLVASRELEGNGIKEYFAIYQHEIETAIEAIKKEATVIEEGHQERLTKKLTELIGEQIDQTRILTEVALLIERGDINEELDRLALHLIKLNQLLNKESSVGKEMDFLIQEMNREVNTIGSKSTTIVIKEQVVFLKTVIEKIREQVQNIE